jgi:ribosomal protein S27E
MERQPATNGVDRCRSCGSSDISFDGTWLVCGYCRTRWNTAVLADELHLSEGIENLVGTTALTGAKDIDTSSLVTVTCDGCGATVTINSATTLSATCHWCRHTLSLNHPVDNGAIPDAILPFYVTFEDAARRMAPAPSSRATSGTPPSMPSTCRTSSSTARSR